MTEKRQPWGKWYWGDWRKDARLRRCSYAARGLWADMLSLMGGECERYGALIMDGQPLGIDDLESMLGGSAREIEKMLRELETKRVFNRVGDTDIPKDVAEIIGDTLPRGTIISRRMIRDKAKADQDRENGKGGGNPKLRGEDNRDGNGRVNPPDKAQKLEARSHIPDQESLLPDLATDFAAWYQAYPLKKARSSAEKAYRTARKSADAQTLLAGATRYAEQRKGQDAKYTAHPATWLNQKRWEDSDSSETVTPLQLVPPGQDLRQQLRIKGFRENGFWLPEWGDQPAPEPNVSRGAV